jgi:hypothetical protein
MARLTLGLVVLGFLASNAEAQNRRQPQGFARQPPAVFEVTGSKIEDRGGRSIWVKGRVRNISADLTPPNVIVTVVFEDERGRYVGDAKGLITPNPIGPGESATFEAAGDRCDYARYEIGFSVAAGPAIPTRGETRYPPDPPAPAPKSKAQTPPGWEVENNRHVSRSRIGVVSKLQSVTKYQDMNGVFVFKDIKRFFELDWQLKEDLPATAIDRLLEGLLDGAGLIQVASGTKVTVREHVVYAGTRLPFIFRIRIEEGPHQGTDGYIIPVNVERDPILEVLPPSAREYFNGNVPSDENKAARALTLGRAIEKQGNRKGALAYYQELVEKYPETPQAKEARDRIKALTGQAAKR